MFYTGADKPTYNCFNPHTRSNIRKVPIEEEEAGDDDLRNMESFLTDMFDEKKVKEKKYGDCPFGSPRKSSIKIHQSDHHRIVGELAEIAKTK